MISKLRALALTGIIFLPLLVGCLGSTTSNGSPASTTTSPVALFDPVAASAVIPFPNDLLFNGTTDSTLNIPNSDGVPFVDQANLLDGYSTVDTAFLDILGDVPASSSGAGIRIFNATAGAPLTQGVDYIVTRSPVILSRTRLLIQPLRPLNPRSTYIVFATHGLLSSTGVPVIEATHFSMVKSAFAVGSAQNPVPAETPALTPTQVATLEAIRQAMAPIFNSVAPAFGLSRDDIVLAWSFTTQSISNTLTLLKNNSVAQPIAVAPTGISTGALGLGLADTANIFVGTITLPYYLTAPSGGNPTAPLTAFWMSDGVAAAGNSSLPGNPPCAALGPSVSTTACFPNPVMQTSVTVPVIVTVPNANSPSGGVPPVNGWPVVIFQHGITRNRTDMLAIAPTLASAGFVTVAIDLPLHGITDTTSPFYRNQLFTGSPAAGLITGERTFDLDFSNNSTGAPGPDGLIDGSGTYFINLSSLITSRDNLRESVIDIINLSKSLGALNLDGNVATTDININNVNYVGHSLGAIVGTTMLGVDATDVHAATLAMPGGGVAKLLDGSPTFGPRIAAGLATNGLLEGTDDYETFLRFAQTLVDSGDPINYAAAANTNHPIHMLEVIGEAGVSLPDQVVPNSVERTAAEPAPCPAYSGAGVPAGALGPVCIAGKLSGTDPLVQAMGLTEIDVTPPVAAAPPAGPDTVVRFMRGNHGSIIDPSGSVSNAQTTCEMQRETATFLATGGTIIPIGPASCP